MRTEKIRRGVVAWAACFALLGAGLFWVQSNGAPGARGNNFKLNLSWASANDPVREESQETALILDALAVEEGMRVADVGAGGGFFTFLLAKRVGLQGSVLATDTDPLMIELLSKGKKDKGAHNVDVKLTRSGDGFELGVNALDRILLSNVFPFSSCDNGNGARLLSEALVALRPGGRLVLWNDAAFPAGTAGFYGQPRQCDDFGADAIIELAGPGYSVVSKRSVQPMRGDSFEPPGYLLVLGPTAAEAR